MDRIELINEINLINDNNIRAYVRATLNNSPDYFFVAPASSTGKHHPECVNGSRGLLVHVQRAVFIANRLCQAFDITGRQRDVIIASTILHDIAKVPNLQGNYEDYVNHPINALKYLPASGDKDLTREISNCVQYHMGLWTPEKIKKPMNKYTLSEVIVYLSDFISATKGVGTPVDRDQKAQG